MNITLVGLNTLGLSMGLALKAASSEIPIVGHDPEPLRTKRAQELKAVDRTHWNLISACENADLVVLALPLGELEHTLRALGPELAEGTVLLDTQPATRRALALAAEILPPHLTLIGGHPVAPRLTAQAQPSAELLREATFYLIASPQASAKALDLASTFAEALGAKPHYSDADEHDGIMAAALYAPALAALAALQVLQAPQGAAERAQASGPALSALAELCAPAADARSIEANADLLLPRLDALVDALRDLRVLLATGEAEALARAVKQARDTTEEWLRPPQNQDARAEGILSWRQLLLGGRRSRKR